MGHQHANSKITRALILRGLDPRQSSVKAAITRVLIGSTVQLCSFDYIKVAIEDHYEKGGRLDEIKCTSSSSLLYVSLPACILIVFPLVTFMTPFDTIYTRVCNQPAGKYGGISDAWKRTMAAEGVRGFYKGAVVVGTRIGLQSAISMFMMDLLTKFM